MPEQTLIKQAQAGDATAFAELLGAYYNVLFKFAYRWCNNREDAEDIAQQASIKLARNIKQFRFDSAFTTWLYRLVINCAKDWSKSQAKHQGTDEQVSDAVVADSTDAAIYTNQLLKYLDAAGGDLKETLLLVHGEGFTHGEAASILKVKESTVSWRIHEARKKLAAWEAENLAAISVPAPTEGGRYEK